MRKPRNLYLLSLFICIFLFVSCTTGTSTERLSDVPEFKTEVSSLEANVFTTKYGNLYTASKGSEFFDAGFDWGDIVKVCFLNKDILLPVVPDYSYVDMGTPAVVVNKSNKSLPKGSVLLAINMGDFTTTYQIATKTSNPDKSFFWTACEGVELPISITITMEEKAGYKSEYLIRDLQRSNNRADYPNLTDNEFANFRKIKTTGMNNIYRTSNPVNAELGRNEYADKAIKEAGVNIILNLSDTKEDAENRPEFRNSYYSTCKVMYLNLGVDFSSADFKAGLAQGLKFLATNKGIYAIHCTEGKDRAGFVSALLECLMGATAKEVADDYMTTYKNYYGVEEGSEKYSAILSSNIVKTIQQAFKLDDFWTADLQKGAESYLSKLGLSSAEIKSLKDNLK